MGQILLGSATTTHSVRAAIQRSQASAAEPICASTDHPAPVTTVSASLSAATRHQPLARSRRTQDLEARLTLTEGCGRAGKVAIERYADDSARLKIRLRGLDAANGGHVAVLAGEREIASVRIDGGRGDYRLEGAARDVPQVAVGETPVVTDGTSVLASGVMEED